MSVTHIINSVWRRLFNDASLAFVTSRSRISKIGALVLLDVIFLIGAALASYMLRMSDTGLPPRDVLLLTLLGPLLTIAASGVLGVYRSITRLSVHGWEIKIILSQISVSVSWAVVVILVGPEGFPRSVIGIYAVFAPAGMIFLRRGLALLLGPRALVVQTKHGIPTVIIGADRRGAELFASLRRSGTHHIVAFVEDDPGLIGGRLAGKAILGLSELPNLIEDEGVAEVIVAKGEFTRADHRKLIDFLHPFPVAVKIVPGLDEVATGKVTLNAARPVRVEDVLGRDPVRPRGALLTKAISGKCVLVTGAGGSIGSEIVRQTERYGPERLILLDISEFALFEIHREVEDRLAVNGATVELHAVLGTVTDENLMIDLMTRHGVDIVFHAAAYKHVRMIQENVVAGLVNNVFGTYVLAQAAIRARVPTFCLVSTDKAVRPTGVMGATKRLAELILQSLSDAGHPDTVFHAVRFGNVLGSSGSVVPLFRQQIERGGPVTVTDAEVTRYFMLIPEAAQLVIQASAMAKGGEVFVLDMGEPVKILDLAMRMIEIAGSTVRDDHNPDGEIEIRFCGLKNGEKLHEELLIGGNVTTTAHERILRCHEHFLPIRELENELSKLREFAQMGDLEAIRQTLFTLANLPDEVVQPPSLLQFKSA